MPDSGWVTAPMQSDADVENVVALFKLGYKRAVAQAERREGTTSASEFDVV
jgi:hypothetical protein